MEQLSPERKFLHDLATPVAVLKSVLRRLQKELDNPDATKINMVYVKERLAKALTQIENIENLHAEHRGALREEPKS